MILNCTVRLPHFDFPCRPVRALDPFVAGGRYALGARDGVGASCRLAGSSYT